MFQKKFITIFSQIQLTFFSNIYSSDNQLIYSYYSSLFCQSLQMSKNPKLIRNSNSQIIQNSNFFNSLLTENKCIVNGRRDTVFNKLYFQLPKTINFVDSPQNKQQLFKKQEISETKNFNTKIIDKNAIQNSQENQQKKMVLLNNFLNKETSQGKKSQDKNNLTKNLLAARSSFIITLNKQNHQKNLQKYCIKLKKGQGKSYLCNCKEYHQQNKKNGNLNIRNQQSKKKVNISNKYYKSRYRNSMDSLYKQNQFCKNDTFNIKKNRINNNISISHEDYYVSHIRKAFLFDRDNIAKQHLQYSIQAFKYMNSFKHLTINQINRKKISLPKKSIYKNKKTLILDLDETLIHCQDQTDNCDIILRIGQQDGQKVEAAINIRPFALEALKQLSEKFELIIFTASQAIYADVVIDYLDPDSKWISHRLYRDSCIKTCGVYVKDLRIFTNRNLSEIALIDNSPFCYYYQKQNGVPILPYYKGKQDTQLKHLVQYLKKLQQCSDLRQLNKRQFKLHRYDNFVDMNILVKQLYQN